MKSSLITALLLTLARLRRYKMGIDYVVQRTETLIFVLMLVISVANNYLLITVRTKYYSSLQR